MDHGVLGTFHPMLGFAWHKLWAVGSPSPGPPAPHLAFSVLIGISGSSKYGKKSISVFAGKMQRGTDIGMFIPHVQANVLLPTIIAFSSSKSHFGSQQFMVEGKPCACALIGTVNPNLNCGDPIAQPLSMVLAFTTHVVGMTLGDILAGVAHMGLDVLLKLAAKYFAKAFEQVGQRVYERFLFGPVIGAIEKLGFGPVANWLFQHHLEELVAKNCSKLVENLIKKGASVALSQLDGLGKTDGDGRSFTDRGYDAVRNYIDSPSVPTHSVPPGPESGAEGAPSTSPDAGAGGAGLGGSRADAGVGDSGPDGGGQEGAAGAGGAGPSAGGQEGTSGIGDGRADAGSRAGDAGSASPGSAGNRADAGAGRPDAAGFEGDTGSGGTSPASSAGNSGAAGDSTSAGGSATPGSSAAASGPSGGAGSVSSSGAGAGSQGAPATDGSSPPTWDPSSSGSGPTCGGGQQGAGGTSSSTSGGPGGGSRGTGSGKP